MNYPKRLGFALFLSAFGLLQLGHAQSPDEIDYTKSVFLLLSDQGACATGFFVGEGKLISNYHVATSVCPYGNCRGMRILRSNRLDGAPTEELRVEKALLSKAFPAFDLALIEISPSPRIAQAVTVNPAEPLQTEAVLQAVGFPACKTLRLTKGKVLSVDPMHVNTSVPGAFGSSGSPLFSSDGKLAAVAVQADSLGDALKNFLFKREFPLRAVRAEALAEILSKSDGDSFRMGLSMLNAYYKEAFKEKTGFERMMASYQFIAAAQGLRLQVLRGPALAAYAPQFSWFDDYLDALPQIPKSSEKDQSTFLEIEKLLTAVNVELNGPQRSLFHLAKPDELKTALRSSGRPEAHINEILNIVESALQKGYLGVQIQLIIYCLAAALVFAAIAALWAASVMYTFLRSRGGFFLRALKALCVAFLLWPLSFLVFLFRRESGENNMEEDWEDEEEKKRPKPDDDYYWSE